MVFNFHNGWHFKLADKFPLEDAINKHKDINGYCFFEKEYSEDEWQDVTLPHTFNDEDLFSHCIRDAGASQKRTVSFYRNILRVPKEYRNCKVIIESEGMRQTCYLYVNGSLAGYYEAGVSPFGFDITEYIDYDGDNLIAVATDNTCTRDIDFCIAETPNKEDVKPGSYLQPQEKAVDPAHEGVGFFWNCNDFNPSLGGISRPFKVHFKQRTYLTLPLYSNLKTKGTYIYGFDFDTENQTAKIAVHSEVRNETECSADMRLKVTVKNISGDIVAEFASNHFTVSGVGMQRGHITITPEDAYKQEILTDGRVHYISQDEDKVQPTDIKSQAVSVLTAQSERVKMDFWSIEKPTIYTVKVTLEVDGTEKDSTVIKTGFRKTGYKRECGVLLNDKAVWLRGYAQRATNEWAAIGTAPQWLKDYDARLIRESNANHIRWMHVAGSPADVRAFDKYGIVCTQPAGDKERESFGRQWDQRMEAMRDIIIAFRNNPSIIFWEAGNNSINKEHMREMRLLKENLDPNGGRFMGCRTLNTAEVIDESEYVGTMLNRHAAKYTSEHGPVMETEYLREESPRRVWDDFSPPDFDYDIKWLGKGGRKQPGYDFYDLTSEELAIASAVGYGEFFNNRTGGASKKNYYSGCAALCWTDSAQHGRQAFSENARMSGRVDAIRNKKQSFDVFRVMQSSKPDVKIMGHWNYPQKTDDNYKYPIKKFNGIYWKKTGKFAYREPKNKTVYVLGSYHVAKIELYINNELVGSCDTPENTFVFKFENIDVTQSGKISAKAYGYDGEEIASDTICTAEEPSRIILTPHTAWDGLTADGNDIAFINIEVVDKNGIICPLCYEKINFEIEGEGTFLGGYNSGKFGRDSVIHKKYVFAECGTNRVFIRSTKKSGDIKITAFMGDISSQCIISSKPCELDTLMVPSEENYNVGTFDSGENIFVPEADKAKYVPEKEPYIKILVNGQEPDTRGVRSVNKNGAIWGAVLCILDRIKSEYGGKFGYSYDADKKILTLKSGQYEVTAEAGRTHLLVNGKENLMDGEPYVTETGIFVMEVSAIISYIEGVTAYFDDTVEVFRIEL